MVSHEFIPLFWCASIVTDQEFTASWNRNVFVFKSGAWEMNLEGLHSNQQLQQVSSRWNTHTQTHSHTPPGQPLTNIETMELWQPPLVKGRNFTSLNTEFQQRTHSWSRRSSELIDISLYQRKDVSKIPNHYTCDREKNTETYRMQKLADKTASWPRLSTQSNFSNELFRPFWHITRSSSHFGVFFESSCLLYKS